LLAEGRLVGQAAAEASPASVMDMSFAAQALAAEWLAVHRGRLEPLVHDVPREIDEDIARLKLDALGVGIDSLSPRQRGYTESWREGTQRRRPARLSPARPGVLRERRPSPGRDDVTLTTVCSQPPVAG